MSKHHGMCRSPEYKSWRKMKERCKYPSNNQFKNYGGRGIKICERWASFENFFADMGKRPSPIHSLDRIDNNGDYCPENCRWADPIQQQSNRRNVPLVSFNGLNLTSKEWDRRLGHPPHTVYQRMRRGWSARDAILTPR